VILTILYIYYTLWTLLTVRVPSSSPPLLLLCPTRSFDYAQPLLPSDSPIQSLFPSREWAIKIPVLILLVGFSSVGMIVGWILVETGKGKRRKWRKEGKEGKGEGREKVD